MKITQPIQKKFGTYNVGVIAIDTHDFAQWKINRGFNISNGTRKTLNVFNTKYFCILDETDLVAKDLDELIETPRAKENPSYDQIHSLVSMNYEEPNSLYDDEGKMIYPNTTKKSRFVSPGIDISGLNQIQFSGEEVTRMMGLHKTSIDLLDWIVAMNFQHYKTEESEDSNPGGPSHFYLLRSLERFTSLEVFNIWNNTTDQDLHDRWLWALERSNR